MSDTPRTADNPARSALQSLTIRGAIAMAIAFAASRLHVELPPGAAMEFAGAIIDALFYGGLLAVGVGRARAAGPLVKTH